MISNELLLYFDYALRVAMDVNIPFGGKLVLLNGDIFQQEPIKSKQIFHQSPIFHHSNYFKVRLVLEESVRQTDTAFLERITRLRFGNLSESERE
jgi:hypothetical protein